MVRGRAHASSRSAAGLGLRARFSHPRLGFAGSQPKRAGGLRADPRGSSLPTARRSERACRSWSCSRRCGRGVRSCTVRRSAPSSSRCVANECRSAWQVTRLAKPASAAARFTARCNTVGVRGAGVLRRSRRRVNATSEPQQPRRPLFDLRSAARGDAPLAQRGSSRIATCAPGSLPIDRNNSSDQPYFSSVS